MLIFLEANIYFIITSAVVGVEMRQSTVSSFVSDCWKKTAQFSHNKQYMEVNLSVIRFNVQSGDRHTRPETAFILKA